MEIPSTDACDVPIFEDLPDLVLSTILRKLPRSIDRYHFAQTCKSVRSLVAGPGAEPGILGQLIVILGASKYAPSDVPDGSLLYQLGAKRVVDKVQRDALSLGLQARRFMQHATDWLPRYIHAFDSLTLRVNSMHVMSNVRREFQRQFLEDFIPILVGEVAPSILRAVGDSGWRRGSLALNWQVLRVLDEPRAAFVKEFRRFAEELEALGRELPAFSVGLASDLHVEEARKVFETVVSATELDMAPDYVGARYPITLPDLRSHSRLTSLTVGLTTESSPSWGSQLVAASSIRSLHINASCLYVPLFQTIHFNGPYVSQLTALRSVTLTALSKPLYPELVGLSALPSLAVLTIAKPEVDNPDLFPSVSLLHLTKLVLDLEAFECMPQENTKLSNYTWLIEDRIIANCPAIVQCRYIYTFYSFEIELPSPVFPVQPFVASRYATHIDFMAWVDAPSAPSDPAERPAYDDKFKPPFIVDIGLEDPAPAPEGARERLEEIKIHFECRNLHNRYTGEWSGSDDLDEWGYEDDSRPESPDTDDQLAQSWEGCRLEDEVSRHEEKNFKKPDEPFSFGVTFQGLTLPEWNQRLAGASAGTGGGAGAPFSGFCLVEEEALKVDPNTTSSDDRPSMNWRYALRKGLSGSAK